MTAKKFLEEIQKYYGKYPQGQMPVIAAYLEKLTPAYRKGLFRSCILSYSSKWNRPPDVAIFEELRKDATRESREFIKDKQNNLIDEDVVSPEVGLKYVKDIVNTLDGKGKV